MLENNPFSRAKAKTIIYWFILIPFPIFFAIGFLGILFDLPELLDSSQINFADPLFSSIFINLFFYLFTLLWLFYYRVRSKFKLGYLLGELTAIKRHSRLLLMVVPMMVFSAGTVQVLFYLLFLVSPKTASDLASQNLLLTANETNYPLLYNALEIIFIVIVAPILEEVLFRGIFIHRWSTKWSIATATIVSSIVFGCLHLDFIGASIAGFILALTYLKTRSLLVPIAIHLLNNLIAILLSLFYLLYSNQGTDSVAEQIKSYWWQGAIAIAISLPWLIIFFRNNWKYTRKPLPYFVNRSNM